MRDDDGEYSDENSLTPLLMGLRRRKLHENTLQTLREGFFRDFYSLLKQWQRRQSDLGHDEEFIKN